MLRGFHIVVLALMACALTAHAQDAGVSTDAASSPTPAVALPEGIEKPTVERNCTPESPRIVDQVHCDVTVTHSADFSVAIEVPNAILLMSLNLPARESRRPPESLPKQDRQLLRAKLMEKLMRTPSPMGRIVAALLRVPV